MKHYYLKDNRIWMDNEKMPENIGFKSGIGYESHYKQWINTLQPCEISESELEKILVNLFGLVKEHLFELTEDEQKTYSNPIEVTNLVEERLTHQLLSMPPINCYELFFKQPKQVEEIEAVDIELIIRRENGNDLEMADRIVKELLNQFSIKRK